MYEDTYSSGLNTRDEDEHELVFVHPRADPHDDGSGNAHEGSQGGENKSDGAHKQLSIASGYDVGCGRQHVQYLSYKKCFNIDRTMIIHEVLLTNKSHIGIRGVESTHGSLEAYGPRSYIKSYEHQMFVPISHCYLLFLETDEEQVEDLG